MAANPELWKSEPPSFQAFEAQRLVDAEQIPLGEVARVLKTSPASVRQLVDEVHAYLVGISPETKDEASLNQHLHVAEALSLERLKSMYRKAMRCFKRSCGKRTVERVVPSLLGDKVVRITSDCHGEIRYMQFAMRVSEKMALIPDSGLINRACLASLVAAGEGALAGDAGDAQTKAVVGKQNGSARRERPAKAVKSRSTGACSPPAQPGAVAANEGTSAVASNAEPVTVYGDEPDAVSQALRACFAPAHPGAKSRLWDAPGRGQRLSTSSVDQFAPADRSLDNHGWDEDQSLAGESSCETDESEPARRPLNRKERRARAKILEKLRKKAR
jgi:hypothetical protein